MPRCAPPARRGTAAPRSRLGIRCLAPPAPLTPPAPPQNLQAKQQSWSAQASAAGGVIAEGVDTQAAPAASAPSLPSVDKDSFYPTINGAGDTLVVVDFYTDWCAAGALPHALSSAHTRRLTLFPCAALRGEA